VQAFLMKVEEYGPHEWCAANNQNFLVAFVSISFYLGIACRKAYFCIQGRGIAAMVMTASYLIAVQWRFVYSNLRTTILEIADDELDDFDRIVSTT
jgi:hypothetical protein